MKAPYIFALGLLILLLAFVAMSQRSSTRGQWGEWMVRCVLWFLPKEYHVYNDIRLNANGRKCQIDHLIVSCYGIFVVETKSYLGLTCGYSKNKMWERFVLGKKYRTGNPLLQNQYHVEVLKKLLHDVKGLNETWLKSVVVFGFGSAIRIFDKPDNVMLLFHLNSYIRSFKESIISESAVKSIYGKVINRYS